MLVAILESSVAHRPLSRAPLAVLEVQNRPEASAWIVQQVYDFFDLHMKKELCPVTVQPSPHFEIRQNSHKVSTTHQS